jgi:very-short-patch-repair endonuclease
VEIIIFFGLLAAVSIYYWLPIKNLTYIPELPPILEPERNKCESPIERFLYDALNARGEVVRTQVLCGKYRIDLALTAYKIAIECDGKDYHSSAKQKAHDKKKDEFLKANGWKVLRFSGKRIYKNTKGVIKRIEDEKGKIMAMRINELEP